MSETNLSKHVLSNGYKMHILHETFCPLRGRV